MLRELIEKPILRRDRVCESCGSDFQCEIGLKGCWCSKVELTDATRSAIAAEFKDCLCPNCLASHTTSPSET